MLTITSIKCLFTWVCEDTGIDRKTKPTWRSDVPFLLRFKTGSGIVQYDSCSSGIPHFRSHKTNRISGQQRNVLTYQQSQHKTRRGATRQNVPALPSLSAVDVYGWCVPRIDFAYLRRKGQQSFLALLPGIYRARLTSSLQNRSRRALESEYIETCRPLAHHYRSKRAAAIAWFPFVVDCQPIIAADHRRRHWLTARMGVAITCAWRLLMLDRLSITRLRMQAAVGVRG